MFEQQIAAGMQWLDRHTPEWERRIDVKRLDLNACMDCVLGQLVGNFNWVVPNWQPSLEHPLCSLPTLTDREACDMGFAQAGSVADMTRRQFEEYQATWRRLTNEWRSAILARRSRPRGGRVTELRLPRFACDPVAVGGGT